MFLTGGKKLGAHNFIRGCGKVSPRLFLYLHCIYFLSIKEILRRRFVVSIMKEEKKGESESGRGGGAIGRLGQIDRENELEQKYGKL